MNRGILPSVSGVARRFASASGDGFSIEPMRRRHIRAVLDIEEQVHPKPWTTGVFTSEIEQVRSGSRYYIVCTFASALTGYAGLMFAGDEAHITNIAVDPRYRRRGFAHRLMLDLADTSIQRGAQALTLEVRVGNEAAIGLYREFGFAPAGIRQRYYENSEDALVMWAHDIQGEDFRRRLENLRDGQP